jgi:hypothetical protein
VKLTVALGIAVHGPRPRNKTGRTRSSLLFTAGLAPGTKPGVRPVVPIGQIVTQAPGPGVINGDGVPYAVSGPRASPTPTPADPDPTRPDTAADTDTAPARRRRRPGAVDDYNCMTVAPQAAIEAKGSRSPTRRGGTDAWFVNGQSPRPGEAPLDHGHGQFRG